MKKSLVALAVLAASGAAMAQSSVTLFGVVDAGVTYVKPSGGESNFGLTNSGNATSRLGFRGVEDLGGGLKAGFWLEGAIQNDDGTAGGGGASGPGFEFKRRASLSLMGDFGEVRLGRGQTRAYEELSKYDTFGQVGIGQNISFANPALFKAYAPGNPVGLDRGMGDPNRQGNLVTYISPSFSGFRFGGEYAFGEKTAPLANANVKNKTSAYFGGYLGYDNGPLSLALVADQKNDPNDLFDRARSYGLGGSYNFGMFKLNGLVRQVQSRAYIANVGSTKFLSAHLGASMPVGAVGEARIGYNYYDQKDIDGKAHQLALGYVHNLSKRTALYGTYTFVKNNDDERLSPAAQGLNAPAVAGKNVNAVTVGLRHAF